MKTGKKQRYKVTTKTSTDSRVVSEYKDDYGHRMRIIIKEGLYTVEHKREGERVFKFYSSADSLEVACSDIETIVDDIKE